MNPSGMSKEFIDRHFYPLFLISLYFGVILYGLIGFQSIDELCAGALSLLFIFHMFQTKDWEIHKVFLAVLAIFLFYLCYSLWIHSNSYKAIAMDFIIQIKPYLAFFCVYQLMPLFSDNQKTILRQSCLLCWVLLIPLGILGFFNPKMLTATMAHASNYAAAITALALAFYYASENTQRNRLLFLLMLAMGLASGRSKFYGFFICASFIILYLNNVRNWRVNLKNTLLLLSVLAVVIFVAKDKIELYFIQDLSDGTEKDYLARFALYAISPQIFLDYFPFGSGFGSFATFASGTYYSPIYSEYGIDGIWGISKSYHSFIADTYYPSLAQFGVAGAILFVWFWVYLWKNLWYYLKTTADPQLTNLLVILIAYFTIENIADATFTSNRGFYFMMFMGVVLADMKRRIVSRSGI